MNWDLIYLPNSAHPPHIGHVAHVMHTRGRFLALRSCLRRHNIPDTVVRWGLIHDSNSTLEGERSQRQLLEWMGYPPEFEFRLRDYSSLSPDTLCYLLRMEERVAMNLKDSDLLRIFVLKDVREHVRGFDSQTVENGEKEKQIAAIFGFQYPIIRYAPLLVDEDGKKICASNPEHEKYRVSFKWKPKALIDYLGLCFNHPEADDDVIVYMNSLYPEGISDADIDAFIWYSKMWDQPAPYGGAYSGHPEVPIKIKDFKISGK